MAEPAAPAVGGRAVGLAEFLVAQRGCGDWGGLIGGVECAMPENSFYRDASSRLTFGMFRAEARSYAEMCAALADAFQLVPANPLITDGMDVVFRDYRRDEQIVEIAWDNWTGFSVVAKSPDSESLVQEIGDFLLLSRWALDA
jgi:hypothetical protein